MVRRIAQAMKNFNNNDKPTKKFERKETQNKRNKIQNSKRNRTHGTIYMNQSIFTL